MIKSQTSSNQPLEDVFITLNSHIAAIQDRLQLSKQPTEAETCRPVPNATPSRQIQPQIV